MLFVHSHFYFASELERVNQIKLPEISHSNLVEICLEKNARYNLFGKKLISQKKTLWICLQTSLIIYRAYTMRLRVTSETGKLNLMHVCKVWSHISRDDISFSFVGPRPIGVMKDRIKIPNRPRIKNL